METSNFNDASPNTNLETAETFLIKQELEADSDDLTEFKIYNNNGACFVAVKDEPVELNIKVEQDAIECDVSIFEQNNDSKIVDPLEYTSDLVCSFKDRHESAIKTSKQSRNEKKPFNCEFCSFKTNKFGVLTMHMRTHKWRKSPKRALCSSYKAKPSGDLKLRLINNSPEPPYRCELCPYQGIRKLDLKRHMQSHDEEKTLTCEYCSYKANRMGVLTIHLRTHTGEKPYNCEWCPYKAARKFDLKMHTFGHTGDKPFNCELCSYKSVRISDLKRHMLSHTGEKPFTCELCSYKTARKSDKNTHMLSHTGEMPFRCELCSYKAVRKSSLTKHIESHWGKTS